MYRYQKIEGWLKILKEKLQSDNGYFGSKTVKYRSRLLFFGHRNFIKKNKKVRQEVINNIILIGLTERLGYN